MWKKKRKRRWTPPPTRPLTYKNRSAACFSRCANRSPQTLVGFRRRRGVSETLHRETVLCLPSDVGYRHRSGAFVNSKRRLRSAAAVRPSVFRARVATYTTRNYYTSTHGPSAAGPASGRARARRRSASTAARVARPAGVNRIRVSSRRTRA